jgi:hypothetical protein
MPRRGICNLRSIVVNDCIFMPEITPAKLIIPANGQEFEFTANN